MKNIIVGVSGGVAAYKSCELIRLLTKSGHKVKVIITENAKQFIHPNTFAALTQNEVYDDMFSNEHGTMPHITLAKWADTIIIAPATATTISRLATGCADNLLTSVCLATQATCVIAPAMNTVMWENAMTQKNVAELTACGYKLLMPNEGEQACGDVGAGRMMEPEAIYQTLTSISNQLANLTIVMTAGPTQERLDPIRYISNYSSGKMGYALATACQQHGATVKLISGPTQLAPPANCEVSHVMTTEGMLDAVMATVSSADIFISTAAIADYKPTHYSTSKMKKTAEHLTIELRKTPDILSTVTTAYPDLFTVGFCAETHDVTAFAKQKLTDKKLNAIVANAVTDKGYPFGDSTNELIYMNHQDTIYLPKNSKTCLANQLVQYLYKDFKNKAAPKNSKK